MMYKTQIVDDIFMRLIDLYWYHRKKVAVMTLRVIMVKFSLHLPKQESF